MAPPLSSPRRQRYDEIVRAKMSANPNRIAYDHVCKDPVCHTIVKSLFEGSQGFGWSFMWALDIMARGVSFDELMSDTCGNCIASIKACICDWDTENETDFQNAMVIYERIMENY